ncbi:RICIN domain-containing protein [Paenibacillus prosopidis]|uniref:RICIN domain-containing protein n=1 Tax=Paenibacillus prosopidis TaxID=630520 RepID=UPI000DF32E78
MNDLGNGSYKLINVNSTKALDVNGSSTDDGASVIQNSDSGSSNQQWMFVVLDWQYVLQH